MTLQTSEEALLDAQTGPMIILSSPIRYPGLRVKRNSSNGGLYVATEITGQVGVASYSDGQQGQSFRQGRTGEMMVSNLQGRYYESVIRGTVFSACNPASQATSAALATTYTGCCVTNPPSSGKNLVLLAAGFTSVSAPAGIINAGLMGGFGTVTHTTPLIIKSNIVNSAMTASVGTTVALADAAATIPTPVLLMPLQDGHTSAALATSGSPATFDLAGLYVVAPGAFVAIYTFTAAAGESFLCWAELPL